MTPEEIESIVRRCVERRPTTWQQVAGPAAATMSIFVAVVTLIVWIANLRTSVDVLAARTTEIQAQLRELSASSNGFERNRWSRNDHDQFIKDELKPLEDRVRKLESSTPL